MLTRETIKMAAAAEILDSYDSSDYPEGWVITLEHFGGTGGSGASLGLRLLVRDENGVPLRQITGDVSGELASALVGRACD